MWTSGESVEKPVTASPEAADDRGMTSLEGSTDTAAVRGLKAVEEIAAATLVAIERAYEAALAQVADLAINRVQVTAPQVAAPERRVSPLVGALQALRVVEARVEVTPEPQEAPVTDAFPVVEVRPPADVAAEEEFAPVVEVIERPYLVDAVWIAGRHAEAKTDQIPVQAA